MMGWFFALIGISFIYSGFTASYFVDESEGLASEEEKERWKATPLLRTLFVTLGVIVASYGVITIIHARR
jgi:hypothetical protein